ncbi:hypothetical protein CMO88_02005 [Candidatus Woesearchaeota archaeon]|nr:hypothetical protein [Candidatus Woesearchaeota archaeon]|tara:strand:+ start:5447 stop:6010 length:564 start_codon:yes stop_codon:yes gene_type:complete
MLSERIRKRNYNLFILSNSIAAVFGGLSIPFFLIFFIEFGGKASVFGTAIAIQGIFSAITAYYVGKASDKVGRKPFLIGASIALGAVVMIYAFITAIWQLFILQALTGILGAGYSVVEQIFLADITKKVSRGKEIGKYVLVLGVLASIFTIIGGFLVGVIPFKVVFVFLGVVFILDTIPLFFLVEEK